MIKPAVKTRWVYKNAVIVDIVDVYDDESDGDICTMVVTESLDTKLQDFDVLSDFLRDYKPFEVTKGQVWRNKETGDRVALIYASDEIVTYIKYGLLTPLRKFIFLQDFEVVDNE